VSRRHTPTHYGDPKTQLEKAREKIRQQRNKNPAAQALVRIHIEKVRRAKYGQNTVTEVERPRDEDAGSRSEGGKDADREGG
jgi:hypothetical protein